MNSERLTVRLPKLQIQTMDMLIQWGQFSTRSEIIRLAVRDFINEQSENVADHIKKMQRLEELKESLDYLDEFKEK